MLQGPDRKPNGLRDFAQGCGCFLAIIYVFIILVLVFIGLDNQPDDWGSGSGGALRAAGVLTVIGLPFFLIGRLRGVGAVFMSLVLVLFLAAVSGLLGSGD